MRKQVKTAVKWSIAAVAFVLIAVILTGYFLGWFTKKAAPMSENPSLETGELQLADMDEEDGIALVNTTIPRTQYLSAGISPMALDAVTVSVKSPVSGLTYKWALSMTSGTPSTYVTLSEDTGTSVDLTCKAAFGSVITLTCSETFEDQTLSTATCTLNYFKRVTGVTLNGTALSSSGSYDLSKLASSAATLKDALKTANMSFALTMGTGTTGSAGDYYGAVTFSYTAGSETKNIVEKIEKSSNGTYSKNYADLLGYLYWTTTSGTGGGIAGVSSQADLISKMKAGTIANDQFYTVLLNMMKQWNIKFSLVVGKGADGTSGSANPIGKDNLYNLGSVSLSVPSTWKAASGNVALDKSSVEF